MSLLKWMGSMSPSYRNHSRDSLPDNNERYFGLENFGNTCYCNSILQALYFCRIFREHILCYPNININLSPNINGTTLPQSSNLKHKEGHFPSTRSSSTSKSDHSANNSKDNSLYPEPNFPPELNDTLFSSLKELFCRISTQKKRTGSLSPSQFVQKLRKDNELFRSTMHQDAHEFLIYLLNALSENIIDYENKVSLRNASHSEDSDTSQTSSTWIHRLFEGVLTNETRCLTCETVTSRDESFIDLSIDIEEHSSLTSCLRQFSASEMLFYKNKFFCDICCSLQEAEKRMKIRKLPNILALHLKRFKYQERLGRYIKLNYRVVFPFELRLFNTTQNAKNPDRLYNLFAVVIHLGSGPYHGHYISLIKSHNQWLLFDDDSVELIDEAEIYKYFGEFPSLGSGYVLFYEAVDIFE